MFDGGAKYALLSASHIACNVSLSILETVALPILNVKDCDCWESSVARYLKVTINLLAAGIGFRDLHGFFAMTGPTRVKRCCNLSGDIPVYLFFFKE